jgi:predicted signal transduction protein with EAL and GGDEF domain
LRRHQNTRGRVQVHNGKQTASGHCSGKARETQPIEGVELRGCYGRSSAATSAAQAEPNLDKLHAIRAFGVRLALDDFGTGFSSLSYLRQFPFDSIKIDRSFVREVDVDEGAAALASSVIRIGKALNLTSLAEGVETFAQADWLTKAGCDAAQSCFFAPPMPPDHLPPTLTNGLSLPRSATKVRTVARFAGHNTIGC